MAEKNRHLQLVRSKRIYDTHEDAKAALRVIADSLLNGELAIASYYDNNADNGYGTPNQERDAITSYKPIADVLVVKAQDEIFYIDNQSIINILGLTAPANTDGSYTIELTNSVFTSSPSTIIEAIEELATYASEGFSGIADAYVAKSGDTMTGTLEFDNTVTYALKWGGDKGILSYSADTDTTSVMADNASLHSITLSSETTPSAVPVMIGITSSGVTAISGGAFIDGSSDANYVVGGDMIPKLLATINGQSLLGYNAVDLEIATGTTDSNTIDFTTTNGNITGDVKVKAKADTASASLVVTSTSGLNADVTYDQAASTLTFADGNSITLASGISNFGGEYVASGETLVLSYDTSTGSKEEIEIDLSGLASEYSGSTAVTEATTDAHNVNVAIQEVKDGKSIISAEIEIFDCGEF